jgi:anti-sigma factor RsiW
LVTCKDFLRELSEYLDDATAPDVKQELEAHIQECPSCWVVFDTTQKTIQVYKGMEPQPLPEAVHERLVSALQKKRVLGAT